MDSTLFTFLNPEDFAILKGSLGLNEKTLVIQTKNKIIATIFKTHAISLEFRIELERQTNEIAKILDPQDHQAVQKFLEEGSSFVKYAHLLPILLLLP